MKQQPWRFRELVPAGDSSFGERNFMKSYDVLQGRTPTVNDL